MRAPLFTLLHKMLYKMEIKTDLYPEAYTCTQEDALLPSYNVFCECSN